MIRVAREVEHGAIDDDVREGIWKRHRFHGLHSKIIDGKRRRQGSGQSARVLNQIRISVHAEHLVPISQKVNEVPPGTASDVQDSHPGPDSAAQELVEKIDVDLAELLMKR
jgi:hypothetical protein